MIYKIYMKQGNNFLLIDQATEVTNENSMNINAIMYDKDSGHITRPLLLLNYLRFNPYLEDPDPEDSKRRFHIVGDSVKEFVIK